MCFAGVKFACVKSEHEQKGIKKQKNATYAYMLKSIKLKLLLLLTSRDPEAALQAVPVRGKANLLLWSCLFILILHFPHIAVSQKQSTEPY